MLETLALIPLSNAINQSILTIIIYSKLCPPCTCIIQDFMPSVPFSHEPKKKERQCLVQILPMGKEIFGEEPAKKKKKKKNEIFASLGNSRNYFTFDNCVTREPQDGWLKFITVSLIEKRTRKLGEKQREKKTVLIEKLDGKPYILLHKVHSPYYLFPETNSYTFSVVVPPLN